MPIQVEVSFPDRKTKFILLLNKTNEGKWKIFKEVDAPSFKTFAFQAKSFSEFEIVL